jgi:hypothetical protein
MPVNSFAPELMELLKVAAMQEVVIEFDTNKEAIRFRFRCHHLRREMRKENHDLVKIANSVEFRIRQTEGGYAVIASPSDDTFIEKLHAAGIKVEHPDVLPETQAEKDGVDVPPMTADELSSADKNLRAFFAGEKEE